MNQQEATRLIRETFEQPFDEKRFAYFIRELLNEVDEADSFSRHGQYIHRRSAYQEHIRQYKRIGKHTDPEGHRLDILIVRMKKETGMARARTIQRNFVADYLREKGEKDAALVAYYIDEQPGWRFSLVRMEYHLRIDEATQKVKPQEKITPARRFSFLVGADEPNHTAQQQLFSILMDDRNNPTLNQLEEAFNIESVTKAFFGEYKECFLELVEGLERILAQDPVVRQEFINKGLSTANFAKKLLGQVVFLYFLQKKGWLGVQTGEAWGSGPKNFLSALFLNRGYGNFFNDLLEPLFYEALALERPEHYYPRLACKIPFLNGGLFEPAGDYDWKNTDILIDNAIFEKIFTTFDLYNFTVCEDEPLEKEVAVDPEMLGKVFESLLEVSDRKSKGAFYTPREIVHYMCQESLINYLDTALNLRPAPLAKQPSAQAEMFDPPKLRQEAMAVLEYAPIVLREDLETLIRKGELTLQYEAAREAGASSYSAIIPESVRTYSQKLDDALADVKICDPAVGSGAFLVGMMHEIVRAREVLTPYLGESPARTPYTLKRHAIQESIYGVDIDPAAVDIAMLRLWLSLVVDEESYQHIKPLPNLEYKIVTGNSLKVARQLGLFNHNARRKLEEIKIQYFASTESSAKADLKTQIDTLIKHLSDEEFFDFRVYFSEIFNSKGGFDILIANPPYISHDQISDKRSIKKDFKSFEPFADIYCYFLELGLTLQNSRGLICYITSNSYIKAEYGKPIRKMLGALNDILTVVNIEDYQIFDEAIVNAAILISQKKIHGLVRMCWGVNKVYEDEVSFEAFVNKNKFECPQDEFGADTWLLVSSDILKLKKKIEKSGPTLEQLDTKIRLGIATGANKAFIVDDKKRQYLIKMDRRNQEIIRPILRGRDIYQYGYRLPNLHILLTKNGINVKKDYPTIYEHLKSFGEKFKKRGAQGQHWTNLRACSFFDDFKKERIVWIELTDKGRFSLCTDEIYLLNSAYFLLPPISIPTKFLLGILNSKVIQFYLELIAETSGMGTNRWINNFVKRLPIPTTSLEKQKSIIEIVEKILNLTTSNDCLVGGKKRQAVEEYQLELDQVIYQIYGFSEDEIDLLERATQ